MRQSTEGLHPEEVHQNSFQYINTTRDLQEVATTLQFEPVLAVDLEADSMFHFTEKVCLLQISSPSASFLIDPLQIEDMSCLRPMFENPAIRKVFHGADYDIRCLYRDFHITVDNLFDTELASRFLGQKSTGLNAMLKHLFGVALEKKYQKKDWSQRPLPDAMLSYAAQDTAYLIPMYEILWAQLEELSRLSWVEEECRLLTEVRPAKNQTAPLFLKFKGAGRLSPRKLAILEAILQARLDIAAKKDVPPFKVLSNMAIMKLVQADPQTVQAVKQCRALTAKQWNMFGDYLATALVAAQSLPEADWPHYPRQKRAGVSPEVTARLNDLKQWRDQVAAELYLDPGLLLSKTLMTRIAQDAPASQAELDCIEGLKNWQKIEFGNALVAVVNAPQSALAPLASEDN